MLNSRRDRHLRSACDELVERLRAGQQHVAESILSQTPQLADDPEWALELIYTDYVTREELGQHVDAAFTRLLSRRHATGESREWLPDVSENLTLVLQRATDKDPELRYPSMEALRTDLLAVSRGQRPTGSRVGIARRVLVELKRHKLQAAAASVLVSLLVLFGILYSTERQRSHQRLYKRHVDNAIMSLYLGERLVRVDNEEDNLFAQSNRELAKALLSKTDRTVKRANNSLAPSAEPAPFVEPSHPLEQALHDLTAAIAIFPRRPEAYYYRARTLAALGDTAASSVDVARCLRADAAFFPAGALRQLLRERRVDQHVLQRVFGAGWAATAEAASMADPTAAAEEVPSETGWQHDWRAAQSARDGGRWLSAADAYASILNSASMEPFVGCFLECSIERGAALLEAGKFQAAIEELAVSKARWPELILPGLLMAKAYLLNDDDRRAEELSQQVHSAARLTDTAAICIASVYQQTGRFPDSSAWLDKIENGFLRGLCHVRVLNLQQRCREAEAAARRLLEVHADNAPLFDQLARALNSQQRFPEALAAAREAIRIDPYYLYAYLRVGNAAAMTGNQREAMQAFQTAIELGPGDPIVYQAIGDTLLRVGRVNDGLAMLHEATRLSNRFARAHFSLAAGYKQLGNSREALAHFEKCVQLDPGRSSFREELANIYYELNRPCDGFNQFVSAMDATNFDPRMEKLANELLERVRKGRNLHQDCAGGQFHVSCGGGERLIDVLQRVTRSRPDSRLLSALALAYCHVTPRQDYGQALDTARQAAEAPGADCPYVREVFADVLRNVKESPWHVDGVSFLQHFPATPPCWAIDVLLELENDQPPEAWTAARQRFAANARGPEQTRRLKYLQARLDQQAGRHGQAIQQFAELIEERPRAEPILHYIQCLRAAGHSQREQALQRRLENLATKGLDGPIEVAQWDFDGDLEPTVGPRPLLVGSAPPAAAPDVSFAQLAMEDGTAHVARFSRGSHFQFWTGFTPGDSKLLRHYTLIADVALELDSGAYGALLQASPANDADADWSTHPLRGLGAHDYGGDIRPGVWNRLALVVDVDAGEMCSYINGRRVQRLYNDYGIRDFLTLGSTALLFADENEENSSGSVNSVQIRNYAMTPVQIAALAGPTAEGIPLPPVDDD